MRFVTVFLVLSLIVGSLAQEDDSPHYTAGDDASWAVQSTKLSSILDSGKQALYDDYIHKCKLAIKEAKQGGPGCAKDDEFRLRMNQYQPSSVYNYTNLGFKKIKAPKKLFDMILSFYNSNQGRDEVEWKQVNSYHNMWDTPPTIMHLNQYNFEGGGADLQKEVWSTAKGLMEEWSGQVLAPVSLYGIRLYHNGSILAPHVDRFPLTTSAIINVDQDVDEPWPLEVYGHDGKATNVTMEPGDMVLYESHSVIHGRPFPLRGKFYANVFVHFEVLGDLDPSDEPQADPAIDIPPYLVAGSEWEPEWRKSNPLGWKSRALDAREAARKGDSGTLNIISKAKPESFSETDENGWTPLHEAIRAGDLYSVQIIVRTTNDKNVKTKHGFTPLRLAEDFLGVDHDVYKYLKKIGAEGGRVRQHRKSAKEL